MKNLNNTLTMLLIIASVTLGNAQTLPNKLTVKDVEYIGVFYKGRDEVRVKFSHDSGLANVLITDLPAEIQKDFPVDSVKAANQLQEDARKQNEIVRTQAAAANKATQETARKTQSPIQTEQPHSADTPLDTTNWIKLSFKVLRIQENGWLVVERQRFIDISGGATVSDILPNSNQEFIVTNHPRAASATDGDVLTGVLVVEGIVKSKGGRTARRYRCIKAD